MIRRREHGSTLAMAILALTIIAMIMLFIGTQTMSGLFVSKRKHDTTVGMASADSAIEHYRMALQSNAADEFDRYSLNQNDLLKLARPDNDPNVEVLPAQQYEQQAGLAPSQVATADQRWIVREKSDSGYGYWEVYHVVPPRRMPSRYLPLTVYFRAWATGPDATSITTSPAIYAAQFRPTYFSDYQIVSDGPFVVERKAADPLGASRYRINGPIQSNGYRIDNVGTGVSTGQVGIRFEDAPTCGNGAEFVTSRDATIDVPGASCRNIAIRRTKARELNVLGVEKTFNYIASRCGSGGLVICPELLGMSPPYTVRLGTNQVTVNGRAFPMLATDLDSASLTILLNGDTRLSGQLRVDRTRAGRVTIAARRTSASQPTANIQLVSSGGLVGAATPTKDIVAVLSEGALELPLANGGNQSSCLSQVNVSGIAVSGAVTIPGSFVTESPPPVQYQGGQFQCNGRLTFNGSFGMHRSFLASKSWDDAGASVGYPLIGLNYSRRIYENTPPAYPVATPWSVSGAKKADQSCLSAQRLDEDPTCGA